MSFEVVFDLEDLTKVRQGSLTSPTEHDEMDSGTLALTKIEGIDRYQELAVQMPYYR